MSLFGDALEKIRNLRGRIERQEDFRAVFDSPQGRRVLAFLCKTGCVTSSAFVAGASDVTSYNNGKRDLVLAILREINKDTDALIKQIEEASHE